MPQRPPGRTRPTTWLLLCLILLIPAWAGESDESVRVEDQLGTLAEVFSLAVAHAAQEPSKEEMVNAAIQGMLSNLDPHTVYYDPARYRTMKEDQRGSFFGIGINIGLQKSVLTVMSLVPDAPASRAGLRPGDHVQAIDGDATFGMTVSDAVRELRGEEGESVKLTIGRSGEKPFDVVLRRAEVPTHNVRAHFMLDREIGYISLKDFGETARDEVLESIRDLQARSMSKLILDLRGNPGGLLPQAIGIASLFVPDDHMIVSTQGRLNSANQEYRSDSKAELDQMPLILLIDRGSASASEIVAGAIQDHDRGLILGVTSWGKGLVQSVFPIGDGSKGLALTTARYYTPSGRNIQGRYDSIDAYFHPESSESLFFDPASEQLTESQRFYTNAGREVYQVRGIVPDVYIAYPKQDALVEDLDREYQLFFEFATRHRKGFGELDADWEADDAVLGDLYAFAKDRGFDGSFNTFMDHADALRRETTYSLLQLDSQQVAWTYRMKHDVQVRAALELFDQATELLNVFEGRAELRDNYADGLREYARLKRDGE